MRCGQRQRTVWSGESVSAVIGVMEHLNKEITHHHINKKSKSSTGGVQRNDER